MIGVPMKLAARRLHVKARKNNPASPCQEREIDSLKAAIAAVMDMRAKAQIVALPAFYAISAELGSIFALRPALTLEGRLIMTPPIIITGIKNVCPRRALPCVIHRYDAALTP